MMILVGSAILGWGSVSFFNANQHVVICQQDNATSAWLFDANKIYQCRFAYLSPIVRQHQLQTLIRLRDLLLHEWNRLSWVEIQAPPYSVYVKCQVLPRGTRMRNIRGTECMFDLQFTECLMQHYWIHGKICDRLLTYMHKIISSVFIRVYLPSKHIVMQCFWLSIWQGIRSKTTKR